MEWEECRKLLELIHYSEEEMAEQRPRIEKVLDHAKLGVEDIKRGQLNIVKDFDLECTRKVMGMWFRRFVDLVLSREENEKVVYHVHPGIPRLNLAMTYAYPTVYSDFPDTILMFVYGTIFDRLTDLIEAAEKGGLEQTQAQCAINQVIYGAAVSGLMPKPDMVIAGRYQCDQSVKLCELLSQVMKVPFIAFDTVRDEPWGFFPEVADRAVNYFGDEYAESFDASCDLLGLGAMPEEMWKKARKDYVLPWILLNDVHEIYIKANPRPAKLKNHHPFQFGTLETHGKYYREFVDALQLYVKTLRERVKSGFGVLPKDAPKVGMMCGTSWGMHDDADMYEEAGLDVVIPIGALWVAPYERGEKRADTNYKKIAWSYLCKGYVRATYDHAYRFKVMADHAKLDGVIFAVMFSCRVLAPACYMVKKEVEEAGTPAMVLEVDVVDPRTHTADTLRTRVEAFAELLKARKEEKAAA
ncbi:MAG: 2-hydroxyacyl-CoA dehydratase family protein [Desulfatiglans sp.]|jgi:benzoyl-CoA reductase/2-hydroxyglutaryl-CoA dehydratase subunit BcrC/BadD/HgdB|nr:2-hydroxyacyl-CoA dehydratase family protein [Thermodesulfobacteriota bacterium]MEE4351897.1 2-hydroxyacyl-CoA dehydratase family protein [Desulfatiglans sp.]